MLTPDWQKDVINESCVLRLQAVYQRPEYESSLKVNDVSFALNAGEVLTVQVDPSTRTRSFASLLQGIINPDAGDLLFLQQRWSGSDYERHFFLRSLIGRVFEGQAWIESLNLDENVTLAARHHGRSIEDIKVSVQDWLDRLGLERLINRRPAFVAPAILQVHQWIRAFLSQPKLVILERPMQFLSENWFGKLLKSIEWIASRGTAVLWLDSRPNLDQVDWKIPYHHVVAQDGRFGIASEVNGGSDE